MLRISKKYLNATLAGLLLLSAETACAAEYKDFLRDMAEPYSHYRQSLSLTSKADNASKAEQAIARFITGWEGVAARYASNPPDAFAGIAGFPAKVTRPVEVGKEALSLIKEGKVAQAHLVLEEVRYLLWDMRIRSGINSVADKANDFHEAMEVVLDHAAAAKSGEELTGVWRRYGAWLSIKWEEQALANDLAPIRKEFDAALAEGRKSVSDYLEALRSGDLDAARKRTGGVKNAYKRIWALDPK